MAETRFVTYGRTDGRTVGRTDVRCDFDMPPEVFFFGGGQIKLRISISLMHDRTRFSSLGFVYLN